MAEDHLINGQLGEVAPIDIISYHHIAFEDFLNHKANTTRQLSRRHCWVGIEKSETEIPITYESEILQ